MLVSLTVGKVDAGMAVLLTDDKRIIEFPSILLPSDITSGSIVDITVSRNLTSESTTQKSFTSLQSNILNTFGARSPKAPVLRCRNATQTSVVLEWDEIDVATASIRSLSLFRNGSKVGTIPKPTDLTTTKISGLAIDTPYEFQLVLKTSAGSFSSEKLQVKTHAMTNLTGITVTPGLMPSSIKASLVESLSRINARLADSVRIDTTHFITTEARGPAWDRAREMNIPIVVPDWLKGCESEGRIVGVRQYYLDADPRLRTMGPVSVNTSGGSASSTDVRPVTPTRETPTTKITPPTPEQTNFNGGPPEVPPKDTPRRGSTVDEEPEKEEEEGARGLEHRGKPAVVEEEDEDEGSETTGTDGPRSPEVKKASVEDAKDEEDTSFQDVAL